MQPAIFLALLTAFGSFNINDNLRFADSLYQQKDYFNSATEYERCLFYNADSSLASQIKLKLARAYLHCNETNRAEKILKEINTVESQLELAELYIGQKDFTRAKIELNYLLLFNNSISDSIQELVNRYLGNIALQEYQPNDAIIYFSKTRDSIFVSQIKTLDRLPKNILLSQILSSIIPGTGEMYSKKFGWGILSLLVNSASVYGMIKTYHNKQYVDCALIFSIFFTRFYNGSRNNARDFAKAYNERTYQKRLQELKIK